MKNGKLEWIASKKEPKQGEENSGKGTGEGTGGLLETER